MNKQTKIGLLLVLPLVALLIFLNRKPDLLPLGASIASPELNAIIAKVISDQDVNKQQLGKYKQTSWISDGNYEYRVDEWQSANAVGYTMTYRRAVEVTTATGTRIAFQYGKITK